MSLAEPSVSDVTDGRFDCAPFDGESRIYVLATQPRCGSHLIAQILRTSGVAGVPLEYFHRRHWKSWMERAGTDDAVAAFRELCRVRTTPNGIFGVKSHWHQFEHVANRALNGALRHATYFYLVRHDLLGQAISHNLAMQTGNWVAGPQGREPGYSYEGIRESMKHVLTERSAWERYFATRGIMPHRFVYETVCEEIAGSMKKVFAALGLAWNEQDIPTLGVQRTSLNEEWRARFLVDANSG